MKTKLKSKKRLLLAESLLLQFEEYAFYAVKCGQSREDSKPRRDMIKSALGKAHLGAHLGDRGMGGWEDGGCELGISQLKNRKSLVMVEPGLRCSFIVWAEEVEDFRRPLVLSLLPKYSCWLEQGPRDAAQASWADGLDKTLSPSSSQTGRESLFVLLVNQLEKKAQQEVGQPQPRALAGP